MINYSNGRVGPKTTVLKAHLKASWQDGDMRQCGAGENLGVRMITGDGQHSSSGEKKNQKIALDLSIDLYHIHILHFLLFLSP